ncbi:hypothetical protein [Rubritalea tangerina]
MPHRLFGKIRGRNLFCLKILFDAFISFDESIQCVFHFEEEFFVFFKKLL